MENTPSQPCWAVLMQPRTTTLLSGSSVARPTAAAHSGSPYSRVARGATKAKSWYSAMRCHKELVHNPVVLSEDIQRFAQLVRLRGLSEESKTEDRSLIGG